MSKDIPGEVPNRWGEERRGWHIEKTISYSDIVTSIAMMVTVAGMFIAVDRRIEKNASDIQRIVAVQAESSQRQDQLRERVESSLDNIESKVDRIIDRMIDSRQGGR